MCNGTLWRDPKGTIVIIFSLILMKPLKYKENLAFYVDGNMAQ